MFPGCSYPHKVLEAIKHWDPPPKDHKFEEKLAEVEQSDLEAMYDQSLVNSDLNIKRLKTDGYFRIYTGIGEEYSPITLLTNSANASHVPHEFKRQEEKTEAGEFIVSLYINDIRVSDGRGISVKEAKYSCADNAFKFLKKKGVLVVGPSTVEESAITHVSKDVLLGKEGQIGGHHEANKIDEDNVGCKLLKAMGWKGDTGLGKDGQGMINPIGSIGQVNRGGLGSQNSEFGICRQNVQEQLLTFLRDSELQKLEFSAELDNLERKLIHQLAMKYGLKHQSKGRGANRRLIVWKEDHRIPQEALLQLDDEEEVIPIQVYRFFNYKTIELFFPLVQNFKVVHGLW